MALSGSTLSEQTEQDLSQSTDPSSQSPIPSEPLFDGILSRTPTCLGPEFSPSTAPSPEQSIQVEPLPDSIQDLILGYVDGDIAENKETPYTAKSGCTLFEAGSKEKPYDKLTLTVLLGLVVRSEQDKAAVIIEAQPELLLKSGTTIALSGDIFDNFSPIELARYAHDVDMLKMMEPYTQKIAGGREKFKTILQKANEYEAKQKVYDFFYLLEGSISDFKEVERTKIIDYFRKDFKPKRISNIEKSFNIKTLHWAYQRYAANYLRWSDEKRSIFWCQVIGYLQRSLPACYAQAFCQGLQNVTENGLHSVRTLKLFTGENFYPADPTDLNHRSGLGFHFGIYSTRGTRCEVTGRTSNESDLRAAQAGLFLGDYIQQKLQSYENLCNGQSIRRRASF